MKVVFLDRDGVINKDIDYLHRIKDFEYTYRCVEGLKNIQASGYGIVIITNQSGLARGFYCVKEYEQLTEWYRYDLYKKGIDILDILYCPHHPEGVVKDFAISCLCRKPAPGMILSAAEKYSIDLQQSVVIGDRESDVLAGKAAGIKRLILVRSGHALAKKLLQEYEIYDDLFSASLTLNQSVISDSKRS